MTTARDGTFPRLENWEVYPYFPGSQSEVLVAEGDIYNDKRWPDGTHIYTSAVKNLADDETSLQTRNTLYQLGKKLETA